jgi:hypothetical protein
MHAAVPYLRQLRLIIGDTVWGACVGGRRLDIDCKKVQENGSSTQGNHATYG